MGQPKPPQQTHAARWDTGDLFHGGTVGDEAKAP
jgi:hypothetical protein